MRGKKIVLRIRHVRLMAGQAFNALSYNWSDAEPTFSITIVDNKGAFAFHVRPNLHDFLQTAKEAAESWGQGWFWIDQICINQADHTEKCHQVSEMSNLYSTALAIIVWPGPTAHTATYTEDDHRLQTLLRSEDFALYKPFRHAILMVSSMVAQGDQSPSSSALRLLDMTYVVLLNAFFGFAYWDELWIIQEICLQIDKCGVGTMLLSSQIGLNALSLQIVSMLYWD